MPKPLSVRPPPVEWVADDRRVNDVDGIRNPTPVGERQGGAENHARVNAASPPALLSPHAGPARGPGPRSIVSRFQIIKTIAWQHSRFGPIAAYARLKPVLDKKCVQPVSHAENWPKWSAKAIHDPA